ncbi:MAG: hypothetical protein U1A78_39515 [Polyangia bacterium]
MNSLRSLRAVFLTLFLVLFGATCGSSDTVVVIAVSGAAPTVARLRVTTTLDGVAAIGSEEFPGSTLRFGLQFPRAASGALIILVDAYDASGCLVASGRVEGQLSGEARADFPLTLGALPARQCNGQTQPTLNVTLAGAGSGTVTSLPAGITCKQQCSAEFAAGTEVKLTAAAAPDSSFGGWSGACTGTAPTCTVTVNGLSTVTATFLTSGMMMMNPSAKFCTDPRWCWDNPLPQGNHLRKVWGTAANNLWAIGDLGTILHWDGTAWTQSQSPVQSYLYGIWGRAANDIWIVGEQGIILHWQRT